MRRADAGAGSGKTCLSLEYIEIHQFLRYATTRGQLRPPGIIFITAIRKRYRKKLVQASSSPIKALMNSVAGHRS